MRAGCGMEEERDPRFRRLSTVGASLNFVVAIVALSAAVTYHWANLAGAFFGYMGPFRVCEDIPGGSDRCLKEGIGPYRRTWAAYVAGIGAILCLIFLSIGALLGLLVVMMHQTQDEICVKFRHAAFTRMIVSSAAAFCSLISFISFVVEAKVFLPMQINGVRTDLDWSFYLEIGSFVGACIIGGIASVEWHWSRKLGGDPTVYPRDPDGTKADTIVNPNFINGPRKGSSPQKGGSINAPRSQPGAGRGGGVYRNENGVAMTEISGIPYMVKRNGGPRVAPGSRSLNGNVQNGGLPLCRVAYDPSRTPLRSSMKRKPPSQTEDLIDATLAVHQNPTFSNTSPKLTKKIVRINTQSTAV